VRDFDFEAADRRRYSGPDAQRRVRRLHHRPRERESGAGAGDRPRGKIGLARYELLVRYVLPLVSIFVVGIGAMSGGIATPTESAALGALATMALAAAYRSLSFDALLKALRGTVGISAMILFIILGATTFSQILSFSGSTEGIVSNILGGGLTPFAILAGMM